MHVLYFTGAYRPDSMVSHTHGDLVAALRGRGISMEIVTIGSPHQSQAILTQHDRHGTRVSYLAPDSDPCDRLLRAWSARRWHFAPFISYKRALRRFFQNVPTGRFDLIHVGMAFPYATIVRHALEASSDAPPVIVTITGGDIAKDTSAAYGYGRTARMRREIGQTLRWADLVQANSPQSARIVGEYGCPADRIVVQPPHSPVAPISASELAAFRQHAQEGLLATGSIPSGRLVIGLGRMVRIKGFHDVVHALPAILEAQPDVTVLFAGPTRGADSKAYAASLVSAARELGVEKHVIVRPQIPADEVPLFLAAADIVIIPSLLDGLNKTGLEGAAVGTPSVVCRTAGISDYVMEYASGIVIPPSAPDEIATAVIQMLGDRDSWLNASRAATTMAEVFSLDRTAESIGQIYESVSQAARFAKSPRPVGK
ncbi:MAG: glycosyltransferase family 4 protein [Chloroflexota bacterium]|nr:glycosyltransferase family 4 protein [Chloroflexota bacterium]